MLPNLPQIKEKKETNFGTEIFRKWLEKKTDWPSSAFELKQTESNSLPFSAVLPHQIIALLQAKNRGLIFKPSDDSRGSKPCDYLFLKKTCAWIVIKYSKSAEVIDIDAFLLERDRSVRKSLTAERAKKISTISISC